MNQSHNHSVDLVTFIIIAVVTVEVADYRMNHVGLSILNKKMLVLRKTNVFDGVTKMPIITNT